MNHECIFIRENVSKMLSYRQTLERAYAVPAPLVAPPPMTLERSYAVPAPLTDADIAAILTPPQTMTMERAYAVPAPLTDADIGLLTTLPALPSFSTWVKEDDEDE
jgi:hypothetical protein